MGKGDQRSKRGKIIAGTFGSSRKRSSYQTSVPVPTTKKKATKAKVTAQAKEEAPAKKTAAKKAPAKKAAAKK